MSGAKTIRYSVAQGADGIPYEVAYDRHRVLLAKLARLRARLAGVRARTPGLDAPALPDETEIPAQNYGDAAMLVAALNANQAAYRQLAGEIERLETDAAMREATARLLALNGRAAVLAAAIAAVEAGGLHRVAAHVAPVGVPAGATLAALAALAENQETALAAAADALAAAEAEAGRDAVAAVLQDRRARLEAAQGRLRQRAERALAGLRDDVGATDRARAGALARDTLAATRESEQKRLLTALEATVQRLNAAAADAEACRERAFALTQRLACFKGPEAATARAALGPVERGEVAAGTVLDDAEAVLRRCEREAAARILAASLADLGYQVAEGFETQYAAGGESFARHPDWQDGVVCRVRAGAEAIGVEIVRAAAAEAAHTGDADRAAQTAFCEDLPALLRRLGAAGMAAGVAAAEPVGARPLPVLDAGPAGLDLSRRARAASRGAARTQPLPGEGGAR